MSAGLARSLRWLALGTVLGLLAFAIFVVWLWRRGRKPAPVLAPPLFVPPPPPAPVG